MIIFVIKCQNVCVCVRFKVTVCIFGWLIDRVNNIAATELNQRAGCVLALCGNEMLYMKYSVFVREVMQNAF